LRREKYALLRGQVNVFQTLEPATPDFRASSFANLRRQGYGGQAASAGRVALSRQHFFQALENCALFSKVWILAAEKVLFQAGYSLLIAASLEPNNVTT